jgi:hypothetical protein
MALSIKSTGSLAFMGIADAIARERAVALELSDVYAALYAKRFASVAGPRGQRTDCLDVSTVTVYTNPRAARRAAYSTH